MNWNSYEDNVPYPKRSMFATTYYYSKGKLIKIENGVGLGEKGLVNEVCYDNDAYKTAMKAYKDAECEARNRFKTDMFDDFSISNNPKAEMLFNIAWDARHDQGYGAVFDYAGDLLCLII